MKTSVAIAYFGGKKQLAETLKISRQAVEQWGKYVPETTAYKLQVITKDSLMVNPGVYERRKK